MLHEYVAECMAFSQPFTFSWGPEGISFNVVSLRGYFHRCAIYGLLTLHTIIGIRHNHSQYMKIFISNTSDDRMISAFRGNSPLVHE